ARRARHVAPPDGAAAARADAADRPRAAPRQRRPACRDGAARARRRGGRGRRSARSADARDAQEGRVRAGGGRGRTVRDGRAARSARRAAHVRTPVDAQGAQGDRSTAGPSVIEDSTTTAELRDELFGVHIPELQLPIEEYRAGLDAAGLHEDERYL